FSRAPPSSSAQNPRPALGLQPRPALRLRTPATPLRSGLPAANMASHINIKDIMDSCGLFSPV
ncbi:hypothetical protein M9458_042077, partial [Cirrhinus mrigala]